MAMAYSVNGQCLESEIAVAMIVAYHRHSEIYWFKQNNVMEM